MHPSSYENMQKCFERFIVPDRLSEAPDVQVLDIGGKDINGNYQPIFGEERFCYRVADMSPGKGVDIVQTDPYHIPLPDSSIDIVLSGQMLEHCEFFWEAFKEMVRILRPDGFIFLIAPSAGAIHRHPVDCYRFYPDAYDALARYSGAYLQKSWLDERGPWRDLVGVFRKQEPQTNPQGGSAEQLRKSLPGCHIPPSSRAHPEAESGRGDIWYLDVLKSIQEAIRPGSYLEIGVQSGKSLALASCPAIGVDPDPHLKVQLGENARVVETTSDLFFEERAQALLDTPPDLVFIDGMHLFENALNDFMHVERLATTTTLAILDDMFPAHPLQAARERQTVAWTGDVWKIYRCLSELRPDLFLLPLDTRPTGMLLVAGLDAGNSVLWSRYNYAVRQYRDRVPEQPPAEVLQRHGALTPDDQRVREVLDTLRKRRTEPLPKPQLVAELRALIARG